LDAEDDALRLVTVIVKDAVSPGWIVSGKPPVTALAMASVGAVVVVVVVVLVVVVVVSGHDVTQSPKKTHLPEVQSGNSEVH
jgi:hypothetical protein